MSDNLADPTVAVHDTLSRRPEEHERRLRVSAMTDEQLAMVATTWDTVKDSETPVGDLRIAMSGSGLFDFSDGQTDNLTLRTIALTAQDTLELRHGSTAAEEMRAIIATVEGKTNPDDVRAALNDLLGETTVRDMSDQDIETLINETQAAVAVLDAAHSPIATGEGAMRSMSNRELADQVSDLLDGQLVVNSDDRVQYGTGATARGKKVGGQYTTKSQLQAIAAHADQIRNGLGERGVSNLDNSSNDTSSSVTSGGSASGGLDIYTGTTSALPDMPMNYGATSGEGGPDLYRDRTPERPLVLMFVDQTHDALIAARDAAEARRRDELAQGGRIKRFFKNMWKGENGIAGAYYLEKYKREALVQIQEEGDVLANETTDLVARERAQIATFDRLQVQFDEDAGERREELEADSEFSQAAKDLIRRYIRGEITNREAFNEECGRILNELGNKELIGKGNVRIHNMFALAEQVKAMSDHEAAIDRIKIYAAESRSNVRTEARHNKVERVIERLQESKLGTIVRPEIISTAAAVALGAARLGRGTLLKAAGVTLAPGILGGAFAGMRENARVKQERMLHSREMAQGKAYDVGAERRGELEETRYETEKASVLIANLESLLPEGSNPTPEDIQAAYEALAMADARTRISNKRRVDLIEYSHVVAIPEERRRLVEVTALAKTRLANHMGDLPDDFCSRFEIIDGQSVDEALQQYTDAIDALDADMNAKDAVFSKIHHRRVRKAVVAGALTSALIGFGAQEALAFASPSYNGLAEHLVHGGSSPEHGRQTTLEGAREAIFGHGSGAHVERIAPSATYDSYPMGDYQHALELPSNYHAVVASNGTITIDGPKGFTPVEGLTLEKNGSLSPESLQLLNEHHISAIDTGGTVAGKDQIVSQNVSVEQYNKLHFADTVHVSREFFYDDNSPTKPIGNAQKLWWAGASDKGLGKDGTTIKMSISHMTANGSFHGNNHISWAQAAHDGKIKLAVSASRDTQAHVYFVDIKPDGGIDIPKDNPASKFFSIDKTGQVEFNGAYAEVVEVRGEVGGVTHIAPLATEVGSNSLHAIPDEINVPTQHYVPHVKLTPPVITHEIQGRTVEVEGFGGPSIVPRRPLEKVKTSEYAESVRINGMYGNLYGIYGGVSGEYAPESGEELFRTWDRERSPRLENDPDRKLSAQEELQWYFDERSANMNEDYVGELDRRIDESSVLNNVPANIELMINIPVAAAYEKGNIYKTLSLYAKQDSESLAKTQIVLSLNWKEGVDMDDVDATRAEVERARADFPQLNIATFEEMWPQEFVASRRGKIYGMVVKSLYDTSMRAVQRANGKNGTDADPLIVTNDADAADISKNYLKQLIAAKHNFGEADVFSAKIHWGVDSFKDYPGFGVVSSFLSLVEDRWRDSYRNKPGGGSWGANSAFRVSALAATGGANGRRGEGVDGEMGRRIYRARINPARTERRRSLEPVPGAWIDTAPERQLEAYKKNVLLTDSWADFSSGGYQPRPDLAVGSAREDVGNDFDGIKSRIEHQISGMLSSNWDIGGRDKEVIEAALENIFYKPDNVDLWHISGSGDNMIFTFTDEGASELKVVLDTIHDSTKEGLAMIDEVYSNTQASA